MLVSCPLRKGKGGRRKPSVAQKQFFAWTSQRRQDDEGGGTKKKSRFSKKKPPDLAEKRDLFWGGWEGGGKEGERNETGLYRKRSSPVFFCPALISGRKKEKNETDCTGKKNLSLFLLMTRFTRK